MAKTIDDRVVKMSFDTGKFKTGVDSVLKGLQSIDKSLTKDRTFKGLEGIGRSIANVTNNGMSSLSRSINNVAGDFSMLEMAGAVALGNLATKATMVGGSMLKSLTLDPVMDGFREYETKMTSIQTILTNTASKGTTLKEVTATLDELNRYADKTIYNFSEMTKNIGTFTAAGVGLQDATTAIKGIANLGAGSGSTSQQVNTAMYQMSQALSQGYLMLQDYNSLVNAGMGGEMFKQEAIAVAKGMGIATPAIKDFRGSLEDKWLTDDVLLQVFENFANDEMLTKAATQVKTFTGLMDTLKESVASGWAQTWESIIGDKDQAAKLFTGISDAINNDIIGPLSDARTAVVDTWKEMGGRENTIKAFSNIWENLGRILGPIGEAFNSIFPATFGEVLGHISKGFLALTESLMISEEFSGFLKDAFKGLFTVINFGIDVIGFLLQPLKHLFNFLSDIGGVVGSAIVAFLRMTYAVGDFIRELTIVKEAEKLFKNLFKFLSGVGDILVNSFNNTTGNIRDFFDGITNGINGLFGGKKKVDDVAKSADKASKSFDGFTKAGDLVSKTFENMKKTGMDIQKLFNDAMNGSENAVEGFAEFLKYLGKFIKESDPIAGASKMISDSWNSLCDVGDRIKELFNSIDLSPITNAFTKMRDALMPIVDAVKGVFDTFKNAWSDLVDELDLTSGQVLTMIGGFIAGFGIFKTISKIGDIIGKIFDPVGNISDSVVGLLDAAKGVLESYQNDIQARTLQKIAVSVLMLSGALLVLSQIDGNKIKTGLLGVGGLLVGVVSALFVVAAIASNDALSAKGMLASSVAIVALANALLAMSLAVMLLSSLGMEGLATGLLGVAGAMTIMIVALNAVSNITGPMVKGSFALMLLAGSLNMMYGALALFALMDVNKMNNSLMSVGVALTILVTAAKSLGKITGSLWRTATGIVILSAAMIVMANATSKFGEIETGKMIKGLTSVTIILGALAIFNKFTEKSKMSFSMGAGLMGLAQALKTLYKPIKQFSELKVSELAKGITSLGIVMGALTLMTNKLNPKSGWALIQASAGLILFAQAIKIFCNTAVGLKEIDTSAMVSGLFKMTMALGVLSLALKLTPQTDLLMLAAGILGLSIALKSMAKTIEKAGSMDTMSMVNGLAALGGGLIVVAAALKLVPTWGLLKLSAGMVALSLGFTAMLLPLTQLGKLDLATLAKGLGTMLAVIGLLALINMGGLATMGIIPLAGGIMLLSLALTTFIIPLKLLGEMPLQTIGIGLLAVAAVLAVLGGAAFLLTPIVPILFGLASSITLLGTGMLAASGGLMLFSLGFAAFATTCSLFGDELLTFFVSFAEKLPLFVEGIALAFIKLLEVIGQNAPIITTSVIQIGTAIINGLIQLIPLAANAIVNLVLTIVNTLASNAGKIAEAGFNLIMSLLDGIGRYVPPVVAKCVEILITMANALADNVIILVDAGINLIIELVNGMAEGIESNSEAFAEAVTRLVKAALDAIVDMGKSFFERGTEFVTELIGGLFDGEKDTKDAGTDVADAGVDGAETTKPDWKTAGGDFSAGLANGIAGGKSGVITSATNVAKSAVAAAKRELDINSPSKVMFGLGRWTSIGLAKGIEKFGRFAEMAASDVANDVIYSMSTPGTNISMLDGLDFNPTIRPVIDLSNVRSGAKTIGGMMNGIASSMNPIGSLNAQIAGGIGNIQNGFDNSDVVKAISKLRSDISNMNSTTNIIEGITYDDGSNISNTISSLINATIRERRV